MLMLHVAGCDTVIEEDLQENEANEILVELANAHIAARKSRQAGDADAPRYHVEVASSEASHALRALRAAELPRENAAGVEALFAESSLVPSPTEEKARYVAALSAELNRTLETLPGILRARVHIASDPSPDLSLDETRPPPRASVMLKRRPGPRRYSPTSLRELVAGAVPGLEVRHIALVEVEAPSSPRRRQPAYVWIGPVALSRGSAPLAKTLLALLLSLNIVVVLSALLFVRHQRRKARVVDA